MNSADNTHSSVPLQLTYHEATQGVVSKLLASWDEEKKQQQLEADPVLTYEYSPNGQLLALIGAEKVLLIEPLSGDVKHVLNAKGVKEVHWSPRGKYVITWENANHEDNLKIWSATSGELLRQFGQRSVENLTWPPLQWSRDELIAARHVQRGEVSWLKFDEQLHLPQSLHVPGLTMIELSGGEGSPLKVATFVPEHGSNPAVIKVFQWPNFQVPLVTKTFFKCQEVALKWNVQGTALLIETINRLTDASRQSYYGNNGLYYLAFNAQTSKLTIDCHVPLSKEGSIHSAKWNPTGKTFAVVHGAMPSQTTIYDLHCQPLVDLGIAHRNTLCYNQQGTVLVVGGFQGLNGDMDFWDVSRVQPNSPAKPNKFATSSSYCAHSLEWSSCGQYLLTAVLHKKLKVDNGLKVFKIDGSLLHQIKFPMLFKAHWRILDPALFPVPVIPKLNSGAANSPTTTAPRAGAYKHPNFRGGPTASTPAPRDEGPKLYNNANASNNNSTRRAPVPRSNDPPGWEPAENKVPQGKKQQQQQPQPRNTNTGNTPQRRDSNGTKPENSPQSEALKKKKALVKKLKQIQELKEKRTTGQALNADQIKKIESEESIRSEIEQLKL
jgi:translation initiation factor 2A